MLMYNGTIKTAGVMAGVVVVLGVLVIGAQYVSNLTGGASAQVIELDKLPAAILVSREDYTTMVSQIDAYWAAHDLATKNQVMKELQTVVEGLVKTSPGD